MTEITALPSATTIDGTEIVALLQAGSAVQATLAAAFSASSNYTDPPNTAPTLAINVAAGNINGTCYYSITYVTAVGETESGPWTSSISPASQKVDLSGIQVSPDPAVIARRIYRTPAGAADPVLVKLVTTINDNTTTTYTDNLADGGLGVAIPRISRTGGVVEANGAPISSANSLTTRFGKNALPLDTGYACSAFGSNALSLNTTGFRVTAIGVDAGQNNTTGYEFTAVGVHALGGNTTAKQSCAFGYGVLGNANADFNAAFGTLSMSAITSGSDNTAFGTFSLQQCTTGSSNVSIGIFSFWNMLTGIGNVAVGSSAGFTGTGGNFNTFLGHNAGYNGSAGSVNVALGSFSLHENVTGSGNVALGPNAGYYETGNNQLWIDNQQRSSLADAKLKALMWGTFAATPAGQQITYNAFMNFNAGVAMPYAAKATNYTMVEIDGNLTFTAAATLTLLAASSCPGRIVIIRVTAAAAVVSASANVVPLAGGAAGTAILAATAGKWAMLQSDGTAWQTMMAN